MVNLLGRSNVCVMQDIDDLVVPQDFRGLNSVVICDPRVAQFHPKTCDKLACLVNCIDFVVLARQEPKVIQIEEVARRALNAGAEIVVSIGGGSTMDTGKGVSQLLHGRSSLPESFERPGTFEAVAPHIVFPTTAGPGAEVSPAMVFSNRNGQKIAVVDERLIPQHVVILPWLATTLPAFETACCILDGVAHSIEGAVRPDCTPAAYVTSALTLRGFLASMWTACEDPGDLAVRERLAMVSIWSGEALRMTGVGAAHALASAVSEVVSRPHGAIVSTALVAVLTDELSNLDGNYWLEHLATDVGFNGAKALVSEITDYWRKFVRGGAESAREPKQTDIARCVQLARADPRIALHPSTIDTRRIERAIRSILCTMQQVC